MTAQEMQAIERAALVLLERKPVGNLHFADPAVRYQITTAVMDGLDTTGDMSAYLGSAQRLRQRPLRPLYDPQAHWYFLCGAYRSGDRFVSEASLKTDCLTCLARSAVEIERRVFGEVL